MQEILSCEHSYIVTAKSDTLRNLWTRIGSNGQQLRHFDRHFELLTDLEASREQATMRVAAVLKSLKEMKHGMEGIEWRCKNPSLLDPAEDAGNPGHIEE